MLPEEMVEKAEIKSFVRSFLEFCEDLDYTITELYYHETYDSVWKRFENYINKPILYEAKVMDTSICGNNDKYKRFLALWTTNPELMISRSSCFSTNERMILKFKGYEYYVPINQDIVYSRLLKPGE